MQVRTLAALLKARGLSHSELARRVGVSRQAVSLWFQQEDPNLQSRHLLRLSEVVGVSVEELVEPLPCFEPNTHAQLRAALLWDRLYPELDDFAIALKSSDPRAVGRFVEVYGLFAAEKTLGHSVWKSFPIYKRHIHPARRRELETLWTWNKSRKAA
jgi:transcriptional regulator with XRE-family HTH domain